MRHGYILIDKPANITSHDVVDLVRKALHERSVGHLGTLDPAATGLMVLAVGKKALKTIELFNKLDKEYTAEIELGKISTTYDKEGVIENIKPKPGWKIPDQTEIQNLIRDCFIGKIEQVPPAYSAVKIGGERAYRKMRQGREVNLAARPVYIHSCKINVYNFPHLFCTIACGSGTYIRSFAHDLGQKLRFGAYLKNLNRTRIGSWVLAEACQPDNICWTAVKPLKEILKDLPQLELSQEELNHIKNGRPIKAFIEKESIAWFNGLPVAVVANLNNQGMIKPRKVFI